MSTRATYQFDGLNAPKVTFYIHHDGYPSGAAKLYFLPALELAGGWSHRLAEAFVRANIGAEFTSGHGAHGDTNYRYSINLNLSRHGRLDETPTISVQKRDYNAQPGEREWIYEYSGTLPAFLLLYAGVLVLENSNGLMMTKAMADANAKAKRAEATSYAERFPQYIGNIQSGNNEALRAEGFAAMFDEAGAADKVRRQGG